jgi:hypothetical protein
MADPAYERIENLPAFQGSYAYKAIDNVLAFQKKLIAVRECPVLLAGASMKRLLKLAALIHPVHVSSRKLLLDGSRKRLGGNRRAARGIVGRSRPRPANPLRPPEHARRRTDLSR